MGFSMILIADQLAVIGVGRGLVRESLLTLSMRADSRSHSATIFPSIMPSSAARPADMISLREKFEFISSIMIPPVSQQRLERPHHQVGHHFVTLHGGMDAIGLHHSRHAYRALQQEGNQRHLVFCR